MCRARTGAVKYFGLISRPVPGFQVPHPRIGEEAIRGTQKLTLNPRWDCSTASLPNYDHDAARGTRLRPIPIHQHLEPLVGGDRKSTRLNSSHANISYAVFCLKKTR